MSVINKDTLLHNIAGLDDGNTKTLYTASLERKIRNSIDKECDKSNRGSVGDTPKHEKYEREKNKRLPIIIFQLGFLAACIALILFVFCFHRVESMNMYPTFQLGDLLIGECLTQPTFGDVVVYSSYGKRCVGRIAACPFQKIEFSDALLIIDGTAHPCEQAKKQKTLYLGENEYFIVSDSEEDNGDDSFSCGPVGGEDIQAKCFWLFRCRKL